MEDKNSPSISHLQIPTKARTITVQSRSLVGLLKQLQSGVYVDFHDNFQCCCQIAGETPTFEVCAEFQKRWQRLDYYLQELEHKDCPREDCKGQRQEEEKAPEQVQSLQEVLDQIHDLIAGSPPERDNCIAENMDRPYKGEHVGYSVRVSEALALLEAIRKAVPEPNAINLTPYTCAPKLHAQQILTDDASSSIKLFALWTTDLIRPLRPQNVDPTTTRRLQELEQANHELVEKVQRLEEAVKKRKRPPRNKGKAGGKEDGGKQSEERNAGASVDA